MVEHLQSGDQTMGPEDSGHATLLRNWMYLGKLSDPLLFDKERPKHEFEQTLKKLCCLLNLEKQHGVNL